MLTATMDRPGHALLSDCRSLDVRASPLPAAEQVAILLADTTVRHDLADGAYAERRRRCADAAAGLGVGSLRDADLDMVSGSTLAEIEQRAARHVICENQRVLRSAAALVTGDLELLGELMFDSHGSLRDLLDVSCTELDALVEIAAVLRGGSARGRVARAEPAE